MRTQTIIALVTGIIVIAILSFSNSGDSSPQKDQAVKTQSHQSIPAEKIEVVHFHATQQCWSCTTVGSFALKTITERFPEEYKNGTIVFRDINGELRENRDMVMKYKAGVSSLYLNAITGGEDNIAQDVAVWRLVADEAQFMDYFESKLKSLLGKA